MKKISRRSFIAGTALLAAAAFSGIVPLPVEIGAAGAEG